jgi:hypothetical protein
VLTAQRAIDDHKLTKVGCNLIIATVILNIEARKPVTDHRKLAIEGFHAANKHFH